MQYCIDLSRNMDEVADIMVDEFKMAIASQMRDVIQRAGDEIINSNDAVTIFQKTIT